MCFGAAILKNIKAANLAENSPQPYMALDREYVISQNPKVIFIGGSIWRNKSEGDQMRMGFTVPESQAQERLANFTSARAGTCSMPSRKNVSMG